MKRCPECQRCYEDVDEKCAIDDTLLVPSRAGSRIIAGKYRIDRRLGSGGMGAVYEGTHIELDRPVAIKLLLPDFTNDPQALERFRREARAAARLNHPNVADTYDYGSLPDGGAYIVMELVEGATLREYMNSHGPLSIPETLTIARQIATGIDAAHWRGIIHRDLKPANIILLHDSHEGLLAKVLDFGIAKLKEHTHVSGNTLTSAGMLIGTPRYMSPEQCSGHELDARSDIYSLGVILYEMLAHRPPFDASTATAIAIKHIQEAPLPLERFRPDIPEQVSKVVMDTLQKSPERRPQSAAELAHRIRDLQASLGYATPALHHKDAFSHQAAATATPTISENYNSQTAEHRSEPQTDRAGFPTFDDLRSNRATKSVADASINANSGTGLYVRHRDFAASHDGHRRSYKSLLLLSLGVCLTVAISVFWFSLRSFRRVPERQASTPVATTSASNAMTNVNLSAAQTNTEVAASNATANSSAEIGSSSENAVNPSFKSLRTALDEWVAAMNRQDLAQQMSYYAPSLRRFYQARNVSRERVQAEKASLFSSAQTVQMEVGAVQIKVQPDGRTATMRFHKRYRIENSGQSRSGEVVQELGWERTSEGWKIVTEYDVRVIG